jgi:hypothetical protein
MVYFFSGFTASVLPETPPGAVPETPPGATPEVPPRDAPETPGATELPSLMLVSAASSLTETSSPSDSLAACTPSVLKAHADDAWPIPWGNLRKYASIHTLIVLKHGCLTVTSSVVLTALAYRLSALQYLLPPSSHLITEMCFSHQASWQLYLTDNPSPNLKYAGKKPVSDESRDTKEVMIYVNEKKWCKERPHYICASCAACSLKLAAVTTGERMIKHFETKKATVSIER